MKKWFCIFLLLGIVMLGGEKFSYASPGNVSDCMGENPSAECAEQEIPSVGSSENSGTEINFMTFVRLIGALALVIVLLYGLLKFVNSKTRNFQQSKMIRNLGGTTLGGNRSIQIVKVAGSYYILGVGEDVQLIKEVTSEEEIEELEAFYDEKNHQAVQTSPLSNLLSVKKKIAGSQSAKASNESSFTKLFESQLKQQKEDRKRIFEKAKSKERNEDG
ncbi:flagellar biosynthetic protein FliO [Jeotgalibacillus aurantiacus]|uniref:flagellar biosynthetic protein FliO n=1 Tax=Jeotgalibacillus aurantiacus TaxID=2763266 RepID=UPI001D09A3DB|nr:flagellar biosynthetic protein FliO [Jeotgalibacillus aurantiacus]